MRQSLCVLVAGVALCAVAEAQTTIYWKRDHIYAGPGGGEIAIVTPAPNDAVAPTTPTGLGVTSTTATSVSLSWTGSTDSGGLGGPASGLAGYKVYRQKGSGASLPVGTVNSTTTTFTDQPLEPSTAYNYTVVAFDNAQNHSASSNTVSPTTGSAAGETEAPSVPANLRGTPITRQPSYNVLLEWSPSSDSGGSGLAGYKVYRGGALISGSNPITTLSYEDSTNTANTAYSYTVKAVDVAGNISADSSAANVTTLREVILNDDFNRADSTQLGCGVVGCWEAGGWSLKGNMASYDRTALPDAWVNARGNTIAQTDFRTSAQVLLNPGNAGIYFWDD